MPEHIYKRVHNPGIFGRTIFERAAQKTFERLTGSSERKSRRAARQIGITFYSASKRLNFEADSGHYYPQRRALAVSTAVQMIPGLGDAYDFGVTIRNSLKGEPFRDLIGFGLQFVASFIPVLPSNLLLGIRAAHEDATLRIALSQSQVPELRQRALEIINEAQRREDARLSRRR